MFLSTQKRIIAVILVLFVIGSIGFLIWYLRAGVLNKPPAAQPPALPTNVISQPGQPENPMPGTPSGTGVTAPSTPSEGMTDAERERQAQDALKRQAMDYAARVGTYTNADGFAAMSEVFTQSTAEVQAYLKGEQKKLQDAHPLYGTNYGQTTRSLAPAITAGTPILSSTQAEVVVQVSKVIENPNASATQYQEAVLTFKKQGSDWIVSRVEWRAATRP